MTSKLVVNTIESDTGISSVSFASSISMSSTSKFFFGAAGIDIGADTNINRPAAGVLGFNINSSEKVRIDSSGRLLIGTTTEGNESADELTVASSGNTGITIRSGASSNASIFFTDATSGADEYRGFIQYMQPTDNLIFGTATTEKLRITTDGNILLGTSVDSNNKMTMYGANASIVMQNAATGTGSGNGFYLGNGNGTLSYVWNYENDAIIFATNNTERLRILSNGAITCGHGANFNLHGSSTTGICLNGNGNSGQIIANADGNRALIIGRQSSFGQVIEFFQGSGASNTNMAGISIPAADALGLETNGTERLRILSNGHVAIGDDIANDTGMFKVIAADGQSDDQYVGQFKNLEATTNRNWGLLIQAGSSSTDESLRVRNYANNKDHLKIRGDGLITSESQCVFEVKLNGDQAFTSGTRFRLNFNYVANQQGTSFDTGNNRFTAPVAGYYQFNVGVYSYYSHFMELDGRCNGASTGAKTYRPTTRASSGNDTNPGASIMASWVVKLAQGDYYEIYCLINSGSGVKNVYSDLNRTPTWWSGFLVC